MLYYVPLELLDMRYTYMLDKEILKSLKKFDVDYLTIRGTVLTGSLEQDQFLNPYSTSYFKFSQLQDICTRFLLNEVKDGDKFYFSDIWFPGIEAIKYMSYFKKINVKMYGLLHAGSFTPSDTVNGMKHWARDLERSWIKMFDGIFLGSEQIRQDLLKVFDLDYEELNKLYVTGICYNSSEVESYRRDKKRQDIVVFPHRIHPEKQLYMFEHLKKFFPNVEFIVTHHMNLSKSEYFNLLSKSKVMYSASLQENFGFAVLEGCSLGVTPVLPFNNTDYKYIYPKEFLYRTFEESVDLVEKYLKNPVDLSYIAKQFDDSVDKQIRVITKGDV